MKVILLQDVKDIGKKDDIVNVSDGYARNYLFPRKWAMEATENAIRVVERKREAEERAEREKAEAEAREKERIRKENSPWTKFSRWLKQTANDMVKEEE